MKRNCIPQDIAKDFAKDIQKNELTLNGKKTSIDKLLELDTKTLRNFFQKNYKANDVESRLMTSSLEKLKLEGQKRNLEKYLYGKLLKSAVPYSMLTKDSIAEMNADGVTMSRLSSLDSEGRIKLFNKYTNKGKELNRLYENNRDKKTLGNFEEKALGTRYIKNAHSVRSGIAKINELNSRGYFTQKDLEVFAEDIIYEEFGISITKAEAELLQKKLKIMAEKFEEIKIEDGLDVLTEKGRRKLQDYYSAEKEVSDLTNSLRKFNLPKTLIEIISPANILFHFGSYVASNFYQVGMIPETNLLISTEMAQLQKSLGGKDITFANTMKKFGFTSAKTIGAQVGGLLQPAVSGVKKMLGKDPTGKSKVRTVSNRVNKYMETVLTTWFNQSRPLDPKTDAELINELAQQLIADKPKKYSKYDAKTQIKKAEQDVIKDSKKKAGRPSPRSIDISRTLQMASEQVLFGEQFVQTTGDRIAGDGLKGKAIKSINTYADFVQTAMKFTAGGSDIIMASLVRGEHAEIAAEIMADAMIASGRYAGNREKLVDDLFKKIISPIPQDPKIKSRKQIEELADTMIKNKPEKYKDREALIKKLEKESSMEEYIFELQKSGVYLANVANNTQGSIMSDKTKDIMNVLKWKDTRILKHFVVFFSTTMTFAENQIKKTLVFPQLYEAYKGFERAKNSKSTAEANRELASAFGKITTLFGMWATASLAAMLTDLDKYTERYQRRQAKRTQLRKAQQAGGASFGIRIKNRLLFISSDVLGQALLPYNMIMQARMNKKRSNSILSGVASELGKTFTQIPFVGDIYDTVDTTILATENALPFSEIIKRLRLDKLVTTRALPRFTGDIAEFVLESITGNASTVGLTGSQHTRLKQAMEKMLGKRITISPLTEINATLAFLTQLDLLPTLEDPKQKEVLKYKNILQQDRKGRKEYSRLLDEYRFNLGDAWNVYVIENAVTDVTAGQAQSDLNDIRRKEIEKFEKALKAAAEGREYDYGNLFSGTDEFRYGNEKIYKKLKEAYSQGRITKQRARRLLKQYSENEELEDTLIAQI